MTKKKVLIVINEQNLNNILPIENKMSFVSSLEEKYEIYFTSKGTAKEMVENLSFDIIFSIFGDCLCEDSLVIEEKRATSKSVKFSLNLKKDGELLLEMPLSYANVKEEKREERKYIAIISILQNYLKSMVTKEHSFSLFEVFITFNNYLR